MRDEICTETRNAMLDYLILLLDDSNYFSWTSAKACHVVLMCRMEQGEIQNYTQVDRIDQLARHMLKDTTQILARIFLKMLQSVTEVPKPIFQLKLLSPSFHS